MSAIVKALLLLTVFICLSWAQLPTGRSRCLCARVSNKVNLLGKAADIQIYPSTVYCSQMEIVVSLRDGGRFCLDSEDRKVINMLGKLIRRQRGSTAASNATTTDSPSTTM